MAETIRFRALLDSDEDSHGVFIQIPVSAQARADAGTIDDQEELREELTLN